MILDVPKYIEPYVFQDIPIPYKSFQIYPILVKDVYKFIASYDILSIDKNKIPDVNVITMDYLSFIFNYLILGETITCGTNIYYEKIKNILELCLHIDVEKLKVSQTNNKVILEVSENVCITSDDFDDIKRIILYQNINDYDDTPMSDDVKEVINDYYSIKNKGIDLPTLEKKKDIILTRSSLSVKDINELTYRRFEHIFKTIIDSIDYIVSGIFTSQGANDGKLEHWIYKKKKDKYADVFVSADSFKQKMERVT